MKEKIKLILKYCITFIVTVIILFLALVLTAKIPRSLIKENIEKSSDEINEHIAQNYAQEDIYKRLHYHGDIIKLNIIYYINSNDAINSVMEAKYYSPSESEWIDLDLKSVINNINEPNVQYIRYWHGSMSILRPLLIFFSMNEIKIINTIILTGLIIMLIIKLRKIKHLIIAIIIGMIMCYIFVVPMCMEYMWTFSIMLISSIIVSDFVKKNKNTNMIFFITGIITCYFDFLTTEIITLFLPLILLLTLKYEKNEINNFKEGFKILLKSTMLWSAGYFGMWFAKWILASIIIKDVNIVEYIIKPATRRINGQLYIKNDKNIIIEAILANLKTLFPIKILLKNNMLYWILGGIVVIELIFIRKKDLKKMWFSLLMIFIAATPYLRYTILSNHSYEHDFFTFRIQLISIISIILAMYYSWNKEFMKCTLKRIWKVINKKSK